MSSQNDSKEISKLLMWWIAFGVSFFLFFVPVPTWIGVIAVSVTFIGAAGASKQLIIWILFGISFLLFFAPVPTWFGVIAVIVTFIGAVGASAEAEEKEDKRLKALADQGDVQAQYVLACRYQKRKKWSEAIPYFELAAKTGHAQAQAALIQTQYDLACKYQKLEKWSEAIPYFEKAAKAGHAQAQAALKKAQEALKAQKALEDGGKASNIKNANPQRSDFRSDRMGTIEYFIADAFYQLEMMSCEDCQKDRLSMAFQGGMISSTLRSLSAELCRLTEPPPDNVVRSLHSLVNQVDSIRGELSDGGQIAFQQIKKILS